MPIPNDYKDIISSIEEKTDAGKVNWRSFRQSVTVIVGQSKLTFWTGTDERTDEPFISFSFADTSGNVIDSWFVDESDEDYYYLNNLYSSARRKALGIPNRLNAIKTIIETSEIIGEPNLDDKIL